MSDVGHFRPTVSLKPEAFQTLVVLLRNHGKVVEKECFLNEVWADTLSRNQLGTKYPDLTENSQRFRGQRISVRFRVEGYQFVGDVQGISGDEEVIAVENTRG